MPKHEIIINRFDGGLNTKVTPVHGELNQSPDLQNVIFDDFGAVETMNGYTQLNTAAIAAQPIDGMIGYVQGDGTKQLLAACNGSIHRLSGTTFVTIASSDGQLTAAVDTRFHQFQDKVFISNGYAQPYKWNGTEFTQWGVTAPAGANSAATASNGTLTGAYTYKVLGVNSFSAEGNLSSATTDITFASQNVTISGIPVFPVSAGVNTKLIARNTAGASGTYYVVTSIANATTTYTDNADDSELSTLAPTDNGTPQKFTVYVDHLEYMFGATSTGDNQSFLYYSNINDPETFGASDLIKVGEGDGHIITGLLSFAGGLLITKDDRQGNGSLYILQTPTATPADWLLSKVDSSYGNSAESSLVNFGNNIAFLNRYGAFDISEYTMGEVKSDALTFNIEDEIFALAKDSLSKAFALTWKNKVWFSVPYGTAQTTNNRILQYDFVRGRAGNQREFGAWSRFPDINVGNMTIHDGDLYGGSSASDGIVYQLDTGTNANGSAIDSRFLTMAIMGLPEHTSNTKVWRHCYLLVETSGAWFMEFTYINDFQLEAGNTVQIDLSPGGSTWGVDAWGEVDWGQGTERKTVRIDFVNSVSKAIQFKFATNTADQYFKVHEARVVYNLRGKR